MCKILIAVIEFRGVDVLLEVFFFFGSLLILSKFVVEYILIRRPTLISILCLLTDFLSLFFVFYQKTGEETHKG